MKTYLSSSVLLFLFLIYLISCTYSFQISPEKYHKLQLTSVTGPESIAFDCNGEGPYTGVSDGRILKWEAASRQWREFAITSPSRTREICDGSRNRVLECICGRPLGLKFNKLTCELYIADAYLGLLVVDRNGGMAKQLVTGAERVPFGFTNALDINHETGEVYFTDASTLFPRSANEVAVLTGDRSGRFMRYNPISKEVTVLLRDLAFANGVALSMDRSFVLVAETTAMRVLRYWLQGPRAHQSMEIFVQLPGWPDNINRNERGEFWVAMNHISNDVKAMRFDEEGKVLELLNSNGGILEAVSDVGENGEDLWIGSVISNYVGFLA